ncbi:MATE family efflux transporter [Faecalicatena sp. AGMB00832]|uniref:MATE family efflux transporter n=1 Tax=Faecalicatena faecalis TaxID=2726362 RepID=A0ABS6D1F9_9FIRM|nr:MULTISPECIES: MATE family efflux transporter [Faecalicatena]MBU3875443.1 MATE family efflux transporter [Faecalicatena faecalis]MCI6468012.1 MATE family efflux transporter [Faecalicatena sp.]MDY5618489.1 MATE family efflux transporter [Lachnospiraceae bacterium]
MTLGKKKIHKTNELNIDWGKFYKSVFALVIPMALQNLINVGVTAADVIMLGKVGETALSGASLAGQVQYIMVLFLFGLTSGATVLTAQYWGKGDRKTIEKILALGMKAAVVVTAIFMVAALVIPGLLMRIFTNDPDVIAQGILYLRIVAFSYVLMGITQVYLYVMRSVERVVVATVVYMISLLVNVVLNAIFIFGLFGCPVMGIQGAALGTLIARFVELILVFGYARLFNKDIKFRVRYFLKTDKVLLQDFLRYALPVVMNEVMWGLGTAANTAILGHMGSAAVAANSVAQVARQLATVVAFGLSSATAIYLGKTIGEKKYEHAKAYAHRFLILSVVMGAIGGVLILIASPIAASFLSLTDAAKGYLRFMFFVMSYFVIAQAFNTTMIVGTFRSGGDTRFGLILDVSTMWGGSILCGWIAAFVFKCSVPVVYMILMCDELLKVPVSWARYRSYKWIKDVTREIE